MILAGIQQRLRELRQEKGSANGLDLGVEGRHFLDLLAELYTFSLWHGHAYSTRRYAHMQVIA
jgi:hypothetical protein